MLFLAPTQSFGSGNKLMKYATTWVVEKSLDAFRNGEERAMEDLLGSAMRRLKQLAAQVFASYPTVAATLESDDVLQDSIPRLLRALNDGPTLERLTTASDFFSLAACQMRRVLLDLCRKHARSPQVVAPRNGNNQSSQGNWDQVDACRTSVSTLEQWTLFHEAAERLPSPEKETFEMIYYHNFSYSETAELLPSKPSEKSVRRWFRSAIEQVEATCGGQLPELGS
jgi:RNA polymerase sigma factor (sigma-70 family)